MRPFLAVHSRVFLTAVQPWPLHAFWPLHDDESCDLHELCPLQALTPAHLMGACAWAVAIEPAANNAAAVATTILVFIRFLSCFVLPGKKSVDRVVKLLPAVRTHTSRMATKSCERRRSSRGARRSINPASDGVLTEPCRPSGRIPATCWPETSLGPCRRSGPCTNWRRPCTSFGPCRR